MLHRLVVLVTLFANPVFAVIAYDEVLFRRFGIPIAEDSITLKGTAMADANLARMGLDPNRTQYPNEPRKLSLEYQPRASGALPIASRQDMLLEKSNPAISHITVNTAEVVGPFSLKPNHYFVRAISLEQAQKLAAKVDYGGWGRPFHGYVLDGGYRTLMQYGFLSIPILLGGDNRQGLAVYRAQTACFSDDQGTCKKDISEFLEHRLSDKPGEKIALFPVLRSQPWFDDFRSNQGYYIKLGFVLVSHHDAGIEIPWTYPTVPIHPGGNPHVEHFVDTALTKYKKLFGTDATLADFGERFPILDCDMYHLAVAYHNKQKQHRDLGLAMGNRPSGPVIDIVTRNHAWGVKVDDTLSTVAFYDYTPTPNGSWTYAFTGDTLKYLLDKLERADKSHFSLSDFADVSLPEGLRVNDSAYFLVDEKALFIEKVLGNAELVKSQQADGYEVDGVFYSPSVIQHVHRGRLGEILVKHDTRGRFSFESTVSDLFAGVLKGINLNKPFDHLAKPKPEFEIVKVRTTRSTQARGYYWPHLSQEEIERLTPQFVGAFPWVKDGIGSAGPDQLTGGASLQEEYGTIHRTYSGTIMAKIPTESLVAFWRAQGYKVMPRREIRIEVLATFE